MSSAADKLTPMQQQYRRIKREIPPDALLLFRLGDFYEMFYDDAKIASQLLNLTLTARNGVPMCGIPHHAAESYIGRLLKAGRKIAICDQLEEARPGKLVNREVTQILSPGAHFDSRLLDHSRHNYLAALCYSTNKTVAQASPPVAHQHSPTPPQFGLALIDLTTGDFQLTELHTPDQLLTELARALPSEIIVPTEQLDDLRQLLTQHSSFLLPPSSLSAYDGWTFDPQTAYFTLRDHFKTQSLDGFGCADKTLGISAAGAALHYLAQGLRRNTQHIHTLKVFSPQNFLVLDTITQRNLEILESVRGDKKHSLLGAMDRTVTPMGARLLRDWLTHPLRDADAINARQEVVAHFYKNTHQLADFRETLKDIKDIERSLARLSVGSGNARDLVALKESLHALPELKEILENAARLSQPPLSTLREPPADFSAPQKIPRVPWRDFPEVVVHTEYTTVRHHPDFRAAKSGDYDAAYRFVRAHFSQTALTLILELVGNDLPIIVPVRAEEISGRNAIPRVYAAFLSELLGSTVDEDIVQADRAFHTNARAFERIARQPAFSGPVRAGATYLIVDDTLTMGGTLANLRGYIESRGGRVLLASALTKGGRATTLAPNADLLAALKNKHGDLLEIYWQQTFGFTIECCTRAEVEHLLAAPNVDAIRDRIAAGRQPSLRAARPRTDQGGPGVLGQSQSESESDPEEDLLTDDWEWREPPADYTASPKAPRVPWRDFPEVIVSADLREAKQHPDYADAKQGDADAAYRFARDTLTPETIEKIRALIGDRKPILAAIHAVEADGRRNAIPDAFARYLSEILELPLDATFVQTNVVHHTGAGAFHRMAFQPVFDGHIERGREYFIVDDNIAVGGTIANARGFIETHGGRVIGATTLTESGPSGKVALRDETSQALRQKHGDSLNNYWQSEFGHTLETLTESEARHLLKAADVDTIRNRIAAARQEANSSTSRSTDRGGQGESGEIIRESPAPLPHYPAAPPLLALLCANITPLPDLCDLIERAIVEGPPLALKEGGIIKDGFNERLDELHRASREGKEWIAQLQQREIERTGIPSLKVRFNNVFGYYIEVTKTHLAKVPSDYTRKQTVAGGERFITPELKTMEEKILGADERSNALEYEIFQDLRKTALEHSLEIQQTAAALAQLDVLAGFADLARHQNYCRPEILNGGMGERENGREESDGGIGVPPVLPQSKILNPKSKIEITDGRHPVLEQLLTEERFVPNDTHLDTDSDQLLIITGPNMAGKSTYIRQVALLVLMAHTGSFIPATRASISLVDRIFSRIGATDDLSRGQSTFLVEMNETANILNNATPQSLVILDEIGRGTSTFDGLSIAWAVAEHIHDQIGCMTLFATHYHELTDLANTHPRVKNYNVAVREWNDQVIFLRKVNEGGADKSYGIHVARLAGLPRPLIARAKEILANLEQSELAAPHAHAPEDTATPKTKKQKAKTKTKKSPQIRETPQMSLFGQTP
jgi:DNA mismatch repair ATPase MutS/hypoxanthine-guanine phosphoribosyltransferase